jgi:hypothetical protein
LRIDVRENMRGSKEKVVYLGEAAKKSHKALFALGDECYVPVSKDIVGAVLAFENQDLDRLHISADWKAILKVALWTRGEPAMYDVMNLLKKAGATDHDLGPFRQSAVEHILPSLYYSRRFDILKKVCRVAKATAESRINRKVYCHLVSEQDAKIVASSL